MNWLLIPFSKKLFFLSNYLNWLCFNSYFRFIIYLFTYYFNTYFFNLYTFKSIHYNHFIKPLNSVNLKNIKSKLFYYLFLNQTTIPLHWVYFNCGLQKKVKLITTYTNYFFFNQIKFFINFVYTLIKYNFFFLFVTFDILNYEITSFIKYLFGVMTYIDYPFLTNLLTINLRSNLSRHYFVTFLSKKNIKLLIFLNYKYNLYYINFIRYTRLLTFGLIQTYNDYKDFDYWLLSKENDFVSNYLIMSLVFSLYNKVIYDKQFQNFLIYNYLLIKILRI